MKSDIQINQESKKINIKQIAKKINLSSDNLELYGPLKAKIIGVDKKRKGKLILVTAINPTKAGEGKTLVSIGLNEGLRKLKKKSVVVLREPSLGPVFGQKGGATGGGKSQIAPIEDIDLHFTGDIHAITSANNLIAASIDNEIYWKNLEVKEVFFKKCLDMNERSLRNEFQITAASEMMSIVALAKNIKDLEKRVDNIVFGLSKNNEPLFVKQLGITGAVSALLKDAIKPNLVQTLENNPAIVHAGPFANVSHGCNSIIATDMALKLADYVVTEAGFGADLGMEKFLNIKSRQGKFAVNEVVIVATIRALKAHGKNLEDGMKLLEKHISNIKSFNLPYVVALNAFADDKQNDIDFIKKWAKDNKHPYAFANSWSEGGNGSKNLAKEVLKNLGDNKIKYTYSKNSKITHKIEAIAKKIYGASGVTYSQKARKSIDFLEKNNLDKKYICIAKTASSLTDDAKVMGVPKGWKLNVRNITLSNGAEQIIVHCGNILTMPGLPKEPQAKKIKVKNNKIIGLD